jgi:hypothetical protein
VDNELQVFDFEKDFAGSLRCIPMAVRFKLDCCGVKLSLRQWSRFTHEDRDRLLKSPCTATEEIQSYKDFLIMLIETRANEEAKNVVVASHPAWSVTNRVPDAVCNQALSLQVTPPALERWASLTPLQRFALLKLTRPGHENANFIPAMQEFGCLRT